VHHPPPSRCRLVYASVDDERDHVLGHQYHNINIVVSQCCTCYRCEVVEEQRARGYDEEQRAIVVGCGASFPDAFRQATSRACSVGMNSGLLAEAIRQALGTHAMIVIRRTLYLAAGITPTETETRPHTP
jgi:hypothetical protein